MQIEVKNVKLCVMVPREYTEVLRSAMGEYECGIQGNYSECMNITECHCTFRPNDKANPFRGSKGKLEHSLEDKIEVTCKIDKVKRLIEVIKKVHPYEEVGIDIYPLIDVDNFK